MTLSKMKSRFSITHKRIKKRNDSINQFLAHIYNELKMSEVNQKCVMTVYSDVSNNKSSSINDTISHLSDKDSLYTAKNSDSYLDHLNLTQNGFYLKKANNEDEFDWECSSYLKLIDLGFTPQIMFANKETLEIAYDTRHLTTLSKMLSSYNNSNYINESSFSLFLHDLFSFVSSLNNFIIHTTLNLDNIFYDSLTSKFFVTDLQHVIFKVETEEYVSDTSSNSSRTHLLNEYIDLINLHKSLLQTVQNNTLLKMINRIFICYIPVDFAKLMSKEY